MAHSVYEPFQNMKIWDICGHLLLVSSIFIKSSSYESIFKNLFSELGRIMWFSKKRQKATQLWKCTLWPNHLTYQKVSVERQKSISFIWYPGILIWSACLVTVPSWKSWTTSGDGKKWVIRQYLLAYPCLVPVSIHSFMILGQEGQYCSSLGLLPRPHWDCQATCWPHVRSWPHQPGWVDPFASCMWRGMAWDRVFLAKQKCQLPSFNCWYAHIQNAILYHCGKQRGKTGKTRFYNYQPQPKYSWALGKIEGKGKLVKT